MAISWTIPFLTFAMVSVMVERWKDVIGYKGLYQAGNLGRVRSLDRIVPHRRYGTVKLQGRILRPAPSGPNKRYLAVSLSKGGIGTKVLVHRVVAAAWLGPCPDGHEVCHGPNGQRDNSVSNLRYDTRQNNGLDRRRDGTDRGRPVKRSDNVKFISLNVAAEESGCKSSNISKVCNGHRERAGGYGWEFI